MKRKVRNINLQEEQHRYKKSSLMKFNGDFLILKNYALKKNIKCVIISQLIKKRGIKRWQN